MGSKRIYEVAKDYGKPVHEVIELLKKNDIVKNNFSSADDNVMAVIHKAYDKKPAPPKAARVEKHDEPKKQAAPAMKQQPKQNDNKNNNNGQRNMQQQNHQNNRNNNGQQGRSENRQGNNGSRNNEGRQQNRNNNGAQGNRDSRNGNRNDGRLQNRNNNGGQANRDNRDSRDNNRNGNRQGGGRQGGYAAKSSQPAVAMHGESRAQAAAARNRNESRDAMRDSRDNRQGNRNAGKSRKEKPQLKGSYATRESRPNRSAGHQMPTNRNRKPNNAPKAPQPAVEIVRPTYVEVGESINVQEFAKLIKREVNEVIKALFMLGMMVTINQDIDYDTAQLIGENFGVEVGQKAPEEDPTEVPEVDDPPEKRLPRPPVITVMGHVDHGKTSLLDAIRKTNVTAREAGGITQHIGAYKVNYQGKQIVFLDTPGHEAFTAMRARGAQVTDVAILVVAADDGVMPQTIEAINHAKAAKVPIIVAINKMDRPGANPDHVKQQLAEHELIPEDWGGDTIMVPVSAHQKTGITDLLEMILLVAEMQELKANPNLPAHGTIIEAQLDKGRGPVATVLVQRGTLHIGDTIIAGTCYGKVRAMINDRGEKVKKALPSTPVEVLGLNDVPQAGDILDSTDEKIARSVAEKRIAKKKEDEIKANSKVSLDDLFERIKEGEIKELDIVVKADVQGTIEALKASLEKIKNDEVKVAVIHSGVGAINESDVSLASAANALIIGFNVRPDANARKAAETEKVDIRTYRVIYDAINDVEAAIKGMLAPKFKEVIQGRVECRQLITISKLKIAGCYVLEGKVTNSSKVRVVRDGIVVHEGVIESLRRFKDDVKEVAQGYECGLTLEKFSDIKEGDIFEIYDMEEIAVE